MLRYIIYLGLVITSCDLPKSHTLSKNAELELEEVKKYVKCESIEQKYVDKTSGKKTKKYFQIQLRDIKRKDINYDSLNNVLLDIFETDGLSLKQYERISIFYIKNYHDADLDRAYYFNNERKILEIAYD